MAVSGTIMRLAAYEAGDLDADEAIEFIEELVATGEIHRAPWYVKRRAERMGLLNAGFEVYDMTDAWGEEEEE